MFHLNTIKLTYLIHVCCTLSPPTGILKRFQKALKHSKSRSANPVMAIFSIPNMLKHIKHASMYVQEPFSFTCFHHYPDCLDKGEYTLCQSLCRGVISTGCPQFALDFDHFISNPLSLFSSSSSSLHLCEYEVEWVCFLMTYLCWPQCPPVAIPCVHKWNV